MKKAFLPLTALLFLVLPLAATGPFGPWQTDARTGFASRPFPNETLPASSAMTVALQQGVLFFQKWLSPQDGAVCHFSPTCSQYAKKAIGYHGPIRGLIMSSDRLLRDHPWAKPEHDEPHRK